MTGDELRVARKALGLTQAELADILDMTRKTVCEMECGRDQVAKRTSMAVELLTLRARLAAVHAGLAELVAFIQPVRD